MVLPDSSVSSTYFLPWTTNINVVDGSGGRQVVVVLYKPIIMGIVFFVMEWRLV